MIAIALLLAAADVSGAKTVEISGDVDVTIAFGARDPVSTTGSADVRIDGDRAIVGVAGKGDANATFGMTKLERIVVKGGARVTLKEFSGRALSIHAAGGAVVIVSGKGADSLRIEGAGTSRVDADGLSVDAADVTLKDAARATVKATKSLTCDLQRASRLVVKGKPANVDKKVAGVAKLELK